MMAPESCQPANPTARRSALNATRQHFSKAIAGNAMVLALGLAAVALTVVGLGALVDNVTDGDGVAVLDHPVARFVVGIALHY